MKCCYREERVRRRAGMPRLINDFAPIEPAPGRRTVLAGLAATFGAGLPGTAAAASPQTAQAPAGQPAQPAQPAQAAPTLTIGYIHWLHDVETISLIFTPAADNGRAGAEVGVADNNTTGRFLQQNFDLQSVETRTEQDPVAALDTLIGRGVRLVVTDRPAADVLKLADAGASHGVTIFNAGAPDDSIREEDCRANLVHTAPSNAMLADALAQYLVWKRWSRWLLAYGTQPDDLLLADAYRRAAKDLRCPHRCGTPIQRRGRVTRDRQRADRSAAAASGLHPECAGVRCPGLRRSKFGICRLSAVSHLGRTSDRRLGRADADKLGSE